MRYATITTWAVSSVCLGVALIEPHSMEAQANASGRVVCRVTENGEHASGTMVVQGNGQPVATGPCDVATSVPAGEYEVRVQLDGALDQPTQTKTVSVRKGASEAVSVNFQTALLEVTIESGGKRAAGTVTVLRGTERVGSIGGGVTAHLTAGTYTLVAKYRSEERTLEAVTLTAGSKRTVTASF